ncbi:MAG: tetratricopeptide repeat protein, partial [Chloroflexota bacterium]
VEQELVDIRSQIQTDLETRREEFDQLSNRLLGIVEQQRREAANATLATALLSFGERQYRAADYVGSVNTYKRALALDNNNPVTFYRLGYVYTSQGELPAAEEHLQKSLEIDEDFAPAMVALGFVYRKMGEKLAKGIERETRFNMAEQLMLKGLTVSPKLVDEDGESWWGALGGLYRRRGQTEQAVTAYEQATQVTPHSSYPFSNLATLYGLENNIEGMLRMFKRVERLAAAEVQAEVDNYWGYFDLLTSQLANGHILEAEEILPSVLETVPPDAAYAFDVLKDTLRRVAKTLHDYPQSNAILKFIERIDEYVKQRNANASDDPLATRPEDTSMDGEITAVASDDDDAKDAPKSEDAASPQPESGD